MKLFLLRYWKILFILLLICTSVVWLKNNNKQKTASQITTTKVKKQNFITTLTASGKTKADRSVELKFQTSGKLTWVGVKEGDLVSPYQAIAKLDTREVQKNLEKALRNYSSERNDFEQAWRVTYDGKKPSDAFNDTVRRILEKNQWDLESAVLDVELKSLAVEFSTLVSPIGGIVTQVDTPVAGINITPASAVFAIADPASLVFEANVDETDVGSLALGQIATITLDAFNEDTFSGKISYISFVSQQSSGGATVFPVKIAFDNQEQLRIGLNGDMSIETKRLDNVLSVPSEAIREETDETFVYKKSGDTYTKTTVETGERNEDEIIVLRGLAEDDVVVTRGFANITQ